MAKLKNVTSEELDECIAYFDNGLEQMFDIINRVEKGYCEELTDIMGKVRAINNYVRAGAVLNTKLMLKEEVQGIRADLAALRGDRTGPVKP